MGLFFKGIPKKTAEILAKKYQLKHFVETGTLMGGTATWAARSKMFKKIWTVELNSEIYRKMLIKINSFSYPSVNFILGDSRIELVKILRGQQGRFLFWLDAHWSKDLPYKRPELGECPILAEIDAIINSNINTHVILIDDARLFLEPPAGHRKADWPTFLEISNKLSNYNTGIFDDVIVAISE